MSTSEVLDSPSVFQTKLTIGWTSLCTCAYFIVFILKRIELNKTFKRKRRFDRDIGKDTLLKVSLSDDASVTSNATVTTTTLDSPGHSSEFEAHIHNIAQNPPDEIFTNGNDSPRFKRTKLNFEEKMVFYAMVALLLFLTYLLLVYLPSGATASLFGTFCISGVLLKSQIADEIRRKRYDRLASILTLLIFAASSLSLITYASIGMKEGTIYEGPARIIGYDTSIYESHGKTDGDTQATRMDLEVAWGGDWGCPDYNAVECQAFVSGALCEVDQKTDNVTRRRSHTRRLEDNNNEESIEDLEKEVEELKSENEKLKEENSELDQETKVENEELVTAVDEAKYYVEKSEEEAEVAEVYKEEAVEAEEDAVIESGEVMEEEVVSEFYAAVADEEAEVIEEVMGDDNIVAEIVDENLDYYSEVEAEVEEIVDEEIEEVEEYAEEEETVEVNTDVEENDDVVIEAKEDEEYAEEEIEEDEKEGVDDEIIENEELEVDIAEEIIEDKGEGVSDTIIKDEEKELIIQDNIIEDEKDGVDDEIIEDEEDEEIMEEIVVEDEKDGVDDDIVDYEKEVVEAIDEEVTEEIVDRSYYYYNPYSFDDDNFEDDWWSSSWSDVWGEYACNDLFDSDLEGETYDTDTEPGNDEWPFVNIYGSCNRCEAYLVDYYSTEHFNTIKQYQRHATNYALVGIAGLMVTLTLSIKQYLSPAEENEIGLLMYEGGQMA